jgi:hypothetical protein
MDDYDSTLFGKPLVFKQAGKPAEMLNLLDGAYGVRAKRKTPGRPPTSSQNAATQRLTF